MRWIAFPFSSSHRPPPSPAPPAPAALPASPARSRTLPVLSTFLVRPFSLAVRLFANMLAGHLLLVTFALLTDALIFHNSVVFLKPVAILPAAMDVGITGFEVLVAVLQAFSAHPNAPAIPHATASSCPRTEPRRSRLARPDAVESGHGVR